MKSYGRPSYLKRVIIILASSIPYIFSLGGDFVFDDSEAILKNNDLVSDSWFQLFHNDFWGNNINSTLSHKSYRPLTVLTFRLNYIASGHKLIATHFKITNLIFHVLCSLLVWITFKSILKSIFLINKQFKQAIDIAFTAALLFSIHPIHVESVSGIVGRADVLSAITFFLTFLSYNKSIFNSKFQILYLSIAILLATISMLFKENGITVLGFCLLYDLVLISFVPNNFKSASVKKTVTRVVILILAITSLLYGRWAVMGNTKPTFQAVDNPSAFSGSIKTKILTNNYLYFLNALLLVWPQWLCYDWSMGCVPLLEDLKDLRILWVILLYVYGVLFMLIVFSRDKQIVFKRIFLISILLIVIPFLPATNMFFHVGFVIAERVLYIPSAGYCLLIAIGFNKILLYSKRNKMGSTIYAIVIIAFGLRTWERSSDWQTEYQLFTKGLLVCPLNAKVHYNAAKVADLKNYTDWALWEYKEAIRLNPQYYQAMNNLANMLKNKKQYREAERYLRSAVKYKKDFPAAWMNLGIVLSSTARLAESEIAYKTALQYRENYPDCLYNLGNLFMARNSTKKAMEYWMLTIKLSPAHNLAWTNLLAMLDNTDQTETAFLVIPDALKELPDSPSVNFAIANIYGKLNLFKKAEKHFRRAIKLFGKNVEAIHFSNLGVLYHRWKKYSKAKEMYARALKKNPQFTSAQNNLNSINKFKL